MKEYDKQDCTGSSTSTEVDLTVSRNIQTAATARYHCVTLEFSGAVLVDFLGVNSIDRGGCITRDETAAVNLHSKFTPNLASCNNRECTYSINKGAIVNYTIKAIRDGCWGKSKWHKITFTAPRIMPA